MKRWLLTPYLPLVCRYLKTQMAIPLFAYSDIDTIETELLAAEIQEVEYKKGDSIAKIGEMVVPAIYIIRSGEVVSLGCASVLFETSMAAIRC